MLLGEAGEDVSNGGTERDLDTGGADDGALTGGAKRDIFVFAVGYGHDTATDFDLGSSDLLLQVAREDHLNISVYEFGDCFDVSRLAS